MFKLESYVTPLLLSYVDKYIKNLKPEDSQLSLWGGDAVFSNLDLRLDVLEQELQLPFTFVNGHIHELRIHVPWTKLGSEPVVITINTIECILKLHSTSDVSGDNNLQPKSSYKVLSRKYIRKQDAPEAPPGYVQSLINRVISNICIVCNNLILKYVEDDIVLSLNIKSAELFSVNEKWERAFVDINLNEVIVRKVVSMQDLTVCLDKRDASGKIETYQDPLLYRCSTMWRLYSVYDTPHSKYPSVTRLHMFCDRLDFSLTDQQLPMFLRLLQLCLALYYKDIEVCSEMGTRTEEDTESKNADTEAEPTELDFNLNESWGSWAWSFVPQVLPVWSEEGGEEEDSERETDRQKSKKIFQFGIFIDKASCIFKQTEMTQDALCYSASKMGFSPLAVLHQYGCSMEITLRGKDFVNVQLGVTGATITGLEECVCGYKDFSETPKMEKAFLKAGVPPASGHVYSYLTSSLFDPLAPENCGQTRKYNFDRETHLAHLTEEVLVERFPAFAVDYLYELEMPEEWIDKASEVTSTFLEDSNWHESSICRVVLGPFCADITSSMVHRLTKLFRCAEDHDYPPYSNAQSRKHSLNHPETSDEDIQLLEEFVPMRFYHLTLFKPVLRLSIADHPRYDFSKSEIRKKKKSRKFEKSMNLLKTFPQPLLLLEVSADCVDFQTNTPMYPYRIARIISALPSASENLLYHCYAHFSFKLFGLEAVLFNSQQSYQPGSTIIPQCSATFFRKTIILPEYWLNHMNFPFEENWIECSRISFQLTQPQLLALICIYQSWCAKYFNLSALADSPLLSDILHKDRPELYGEILGVECRSLKTESVTAYKGAILSLSLKLQTREHMSVLLHAPEATNEIHSGAAFEKKTANLMTNCGNLNISETEHWFQFIIQIPKEIPANSPLLLTAHMSGSTLCLEPALVTWLSYEIPLFCDDQITAENVSSGVLKEVEEESTCSSHTPVASGSQSLSMSPSVGTADASHIGFYKDFEQLLVDYHEILKSLVLQIEVQSCCVLFPNCPWSVNEFEKSSTSCSWQEAFRTNSLSAACILSLPTFMIQNNGASSILKQPLDILHTDLPVCSLKDISTSQENFPWTLTVSNFSMYTIDNRQKPQEIFFILSSSMASATIAMSAKLNQTQLGLCIHVDTKALNLNCSASQVHLIVDCLSVIPKSINLLHTMKIWMVHFHQKPNQYQDSRNSVVELNPTNNLNTNSQPLAVAECEKDKGVSEEENTEKNSSSTLIVKPSRKVTLWVQLTLPKFALNLFGSFASEKCSENFHVQFDAEEIIASLDIQEVYSKMKIKLSSLNINCFLKSDEEWCPGPYEGIVLCSSDKLPRSIQVPAVNNSGSGRRTSLKTDNQPFLLATYTQALCTNAKQKWASNLKHNVHVSTEITKYISEIDVKLRPFDLILWMPLINIMQENCYPLIKMFWLKSSKAQTQKIHSEEPRGIGFSNRNLPLVYISTSTVRIFLPKYQIDTYSERDSNLKHDDHFQELHSISHSSKPDMLLLQCDYITLTSQVDNPLSRIILRTDLYSAAQHSKTLGLPGSEIEDRQYQLDICGLSFGSVVWQDIAKKTKVQKVIPPHPPIMGENPALEWNIGVVNGSRKLADHEPVLIIPIMSSLDIRFAVAPAIVCNHPSYPENSKSIIVAGITVETSVTCDICIYMSIQQMHLLCAVLENNISLLFPSRLSSFQKVGSDSHSTRIKLSDILRDSGIESETSTLLPASAVSPDSLSVSMPLNKNNGYNSKDFVPFELLVTAGSISIILFAHEEDLLTEKPKKGNIYGKRKVYKSKLRSEKLENKVNRYTPSTSDVVEEHEETVNVSYKSKRKGKKHHLDKSSSSASAPDPSTVQPISPNEEIPQAFCENDEEGYEGSSDSSGNENICNTSMKKEAARKIYSFLCVSIAQPHSFITCHPSSQKFETSCFDLQIRGACHSQYIQETETCVVPTLSTFTVPWLETKPGEPDPKTGIPPALYTITCTDFLYEPAKLKFRIERPVKANLSISMWNQISMFAKSFKQKKAEPYLVSPLDITVQPLTEEKIITEGSTVSKLDKMWTNVKILEFSTVQVIVQVDVVPKPKNILLIISSDSLEAKLDIETSGDHITKLQSYLEITGAILKTIGWNQSWPIIHPLSATITAKCQWEPWMQVTANINGKTLFLNCGTHYMLSLKTVIDSIMEFVQVKEEKMQIIEATATYRKDEKSKAEKKKMKMEAKKQHWNDDLRKGTFQFIQDSDGGNLQPDIHEIVFSKANQSHPATMTWRYPEPRTLTKIDVSPVPFQSSSCKEDATSDGNGQIACYIQYWDNMQQEFINFCDFELSETTHCSLELPLLCSDSAAVSDMWRALLNYGKTNEHENQPVDEAAFLSPLALAACMCIDSSFDPCLIPTVQIILSFDLLRITFYNYFAESGNTPKLFPFVFDGLSPVNQEFMVLSLDSPTLSYNRWPSRQKIDGFFKVTCDILEYKNLTLLPLMDPFDFQGQGTLTYGTEKHPVIEAEVVFHPCFVRITQSTIYTLNYSIHSWLKDIKSSLYKNCSEHMLPNYYIICNNTQEKIRFGQIETDESIILPSQKMHAYSWRSHKTNQFLRVCLESLKWKWSKAFSIDHFGTQILVMDNGVTLIIKIKSLSNLQKQVTIDGQLIVCSRLSSPIQLKLSSAGLTPHAQDCSRLKLVTTLPPKSCLPSLVLSLKQYKGLRISLMGATDSLVWSEEVKINGNVENQLIKVPLKGKHQFQSIWCRLIQMKLAKNICISVVLLCPLFLIRNHLPRSLIANVDSCSQTPAYSAEIEGRGAEHQLFTVADSNQSIQLSFQMSPGMKLSSPPIQVSTSDIAEVPHKLPPETEDLEQLCYQWHSTHKICWPYSNLERPPEITEFRETLYPCTANSAAFPIMKTSEAPNTELKIELSQRWSGFNTVLIDVKPWALFINRLDIDLFLVEPGGREWKLSPNSVFTPPPLEERFKLGVQLEEEHFTSIPLKLSDESPKHQSQSKGIIPFIGFITLAIEIKIDTTKVCLFRLKSEIQEGIRIITAFPVVSISNTTCHELVLITYALSSITAKVNLPEIKQTSTITKCSPNNGYLHPLLFWEIVIPFPLPEVSEDIKQFMFYLLFCNPGQNEYQWSYPLRISSEVLEDVRHSVAVPIIEKGSSWSTRPYVVTSHRRHGLAFLTLSDDPCPLLMIHNRTNFSLYYGQSCDESEGFTVQEEREKHQFLPTLPPGCCSHYTIPAIQNKFPAFVETFPTLHLAWKKDVACIWSIPIDITMDNDQFVHIPEACDVRVCKERVGHTIHLFIEPANRVELSAKEIRSRIGLTAQRSVQHTISDHQLEKLTPLSLIADQEMTNTNQMSTSPPIPSSIARVTRQNSDIQSIHFALYLSIRISHLSLIVCDELKLHGKSTEIVRLNIDNALLVARSKNLAHSGQKVNDKYLIQEINICFENIQLDNQMEQEDTTVYDFPVVLQQDLNSKTTYKLKNTDDTYLPNKTREKAFVVIDIVLEIPVNCNKRVVMQKLGLRLQPMSLFLEDALYYRLLNLYRSYIPVEFHQHKPLWRNVYLPKDVTTISNSLKNPVHFQHMKIEIGEVYLSIHASLKLYLSLERSLLIFQPFEKNELFTNFYELGRMFVFHYLTGALLRAGWVVGSLDLLGNPAGFARAVGTGVSDFVLLPYRGLLNGPRAFVTGLSHGAVALFTQISSGALTCVTNLAASVSKNMDLLSLDSDHLARQELLRRHLPQGVTRGLLQGLSGFGISLLGAIAGIVDHPLQVLVSPSTPINTATGIVGGLGKGLVGVFTKPIGGAAELVSQTGYGLLHGAGWLNLPTRVHESINLEAGDRSSSSLKFICKLVQSATLGEILLSLEATHVNESGQYEGDVLVLTSEVLCVVSVKEDNQQRTFALTEIKCQKSDADRSTILLIPEVVNDGHLFQEAVHIKDRVAEYVQRNYLYKSGEQQINLHDPDSGLDSANKPSSTSHVYFVQPKFRSLFLTLFNSAKRKIMGKGFSI